MWAVTELLLTRETRARQPLPPAHTRRAPPRGLRGGSSLPTGRRGCWAPSCTRWGRKVGSRGAPRKGVTQNLLPPDLPFASPQPRPAPSEPCLGTAPACSAHRPTARPSKEPQGARAGGGIEAMAPERPWVSEEPAERSGDLGGRRRVPTRAVSSSHPGAGSLQAGAPSKPLAHTQGTLRGRRRPTDAG